MEIWKDIKGYEGFYQISSFGRVKRLANCYSKRKERILLNSYLPSHILLFIYQKKGNLKITAFTN